MAKGINKVIIVGRLTRDPESRTFGNGGKVTKLGLACNNSKKNMQSGQWEDVPMFIDCEVYNQGENGRQADIAEQYMKKGKEIAIEGRLELDTWDDKQSGQKRTKHKIRVESFQLIGSRDDVSAGGQQHNDGESGGGGYSRPSRPAAPPARNGAASRSNSYNAPSAPPDEYPQESNGSDDDIPF